MCIGAPPLLHVHVTHVCAERVLVGAVSVWVLYQCYNHYRVIDIEGSVVTIRSTCEQVSSSH